MIMLIGAYSMSVIVYVAALRLSKNRGPDYLGLCQLNAFYGARLEFPALHDRDTLFLNHMLSPLVFSHDHFVRKMVRIFAYLHRSAGGDQKSNHALGGPVQYV